MKILVNGVPREIADPNLGTALYELGYGDCVVATAVNGEFVATTARRSVALSDGDLVEVLAPMQGG